MADRIIFKGVSELRSQVTKQIQQALNDMPGTQREKSLATGINTYQVGGLVLGRSESMSIESLLGAAAKLGITIIGEVRV